MPIELAATARQKCVLGNLCPLSVGNVCLVAPSAARQKQGIQRSLVLTFLFQLIGAMVLLAEFAENLMFLASGLVDGQLGKALSFKLSKLYAQLIGRGLEFQLTNRDVPEMDGR